MATTTNNQSEATEAENPESINENNPEAEAAEGPAEDSKNAEAAKYRRRLRETEAELEAAREQAQNAQRAFVEHLTESSEKIRPGALWASGVTLAQMLDADGNVDREKVTEAANLAVEQFGLSRVPKPDPTQGLGGGVNFGPSFSDAFRPNL